MEDEVVFFLFFFASGDVHYAKSTVMLIVANMFCRLPLLIAVVCPRRPHCSTYSALDGSCMNPFDVVFSIFIYSV